MADRLISADAVKEYVREQVNLPLPKDRLYMVVPIEDFITNLIDNAPTIEAELIKHGRWKQIVHPWYECSECGERTAVVNLNGEVVWNYCPNCGAKMDESTMGQVKAEEPINEPSEPDYTITCADAPMTYTEVKR